MKAVELIYNILGKKTSKQLEEEKMRILKELITEHKRKEAEKLDEYAKQLASDYDVKHIVVSNVNGEMVLSTDEKAYSNAIKGSSIFEYIQSEFPKAKMVVVKDDEGYKNIYKFKNKIYSIRADGEMSSIELRRIAQMLEEGSKRFKEEEE
ncbi:hypothetical protein DRN74_03630 [Candidatus Micrarchaeota archaeon]|nr:MAG: hypothetical protein DRN74_03630 [Candidatus Micrarchaeota archaeon]